MELNFDKFKLGGLHEKHTVAILNLGTILEFAKRQKKPRKPMSRWPVAKPFSLQIDYLIRHGPH
jgi:hypothetical protein